MGITARDSKGRISKGNNLIHGYSDSSLYDCWVAMKARCFNKRNPQYKNYGDRGITVCDRWKNSFSNFMNDMGDKPNPRSTLDRIDNNKGYEPGNCRWVSIQLQQSNRRDNNPVVGVYYEFSRNKWVASITRFGKKTFLGRFNTSSEAAKVRQNSERLLDV